MDAIDNRNLALLTQCWNETPADSRPTPDAPRHWKVNTLRMVLFAMRKAGDAALFDQVTVRLERSFGSTHDVRASAKLVAE